MNRGFFVFMVGVIITLFGVGGVENSLNDTMLLGAVLISLGGLLMAWVGTVMIRHDEWLEDRDDVKRRTWF